MKYTYVAVFEEDDEKIGVTVPDIPGCISFGDDYADAIEMAQDAAAMLLVDYEDEGKELPLCTSISVFQQNGKIASMIVVDTDKWRKANDNRAVKKTLSIPSWLNTKAELLGVNFSQVLQDALKKLVGAA